MGNSITISSTESTLSDSEYDSCDLHDVKFIPNVSSFVLERQENLYKSHAKKPAKVKCEHKLIPLSEDPTCGFVQTLTDRSNAQQDYIPQNYERYFRSRDDMPMEFNTGRLLPEFPELRDSYDQFCMTMSENSSRDDLDGKLSNKGSAMSVGLCDLKSTRGMRDSMYASDESVHACKRRRKTNLEQIDADGNNHRWSMPEFTKLWQQNCDSDPYCYVNDQYHEDKQSFKEQSLQTCSTPVLRNTNSNRSSLEYPSSEDCRQEMVKPKPSAKERIVLGESKSCPSLALVGHSKSYDIRDYDSSGFCDDSDDNSSSFSPMQSRTSVNTVKENPLWLGYKADLKDSGIYANEDVDSSTLLNESDVYANDSGFNGISNGARDSPEGEETNFDQLEESPSDMLSQPKNTVERYENSEMGHACDLESHLKTHKAHSAGKQTFDGGKGKRCAELMQEYIVKRTLDSYAPSSSFYRTSTV